MSTVTSGHLSSDGGIRGHSAGDYYPYRVMAQGKIDSLVWWVINPDGTKRSRWSTAAIAVKVARLYHSVEALRHESFNH